MIQKHSYDTNYFSFRRLFSEVTGFDFLEVLHLNGGFENVGDTPGNDNNSECHQIFYNNMRGSSFMDCYTEFINSVIRLHFDESIVYQKYPTLRIQIPEGKGVAAYHVDKDYNHPEDEVNVWLPFTHAKDTASIYIESEPGKGDYMPQDVNYGEYIMFEGGKLSHGNEINKTGKTRVSIDMRVIPLSKYKPSEMKGLAHGKVRTTEGENAYYSIIH